MHSTQNRSMYICFVFFYCKGSLNLREHVECYGRRPILMNDGVLVAGLTNP